MPSDLDIKLTSVARFVLIAADYLRELERRESKGNECDICHKTKEWHELRNINMLTPLGNGLIFYYCADDLSCTEKMQKHIEESVRKIIRLNEIQNITCKLEPLTLE
jgi:hypothetical protein